MAAEGALSSLSRYEALFELASEINASTSLEKVADLFVGRLKYVADVFSWRYFRLDNRDSEGSKAPAGAMVIDGFRGKASVSELASDNLCQLELHVWEDRKSRFVEGDELQVAKETLPDQFRKDKVVQIYVCPRIEASALQSIFLYAAQRKPFNELDVRFLTFASQIFHDKVYLLWEQKRMRELELAYLQQEVMLRQNDKLATLGKLSAGLAHELNNPASAAKRGAEHLREEVDRLDRAQLALLSCALDGEQISLLGDLTKSVLENESPGGGDELDALARSDLESEVEDWLDERGFEEPWELAPTLVGIGFGIGRLEALSDSFDTNQVRAIIPALSSLHASRALLHEIREGSGRVSEIVKALKSYSYLDQGPVQSVNLHEGLDNTLVILRSKMRKGVEVVRVYDDALPQIEAFGTELNQVWTNIIDNAVDAMGGEGTLTISTRKEGQWAVVEIEDTGPGIPADIVETIFDPFMTTKAPGEGTGMGLNISHNIIVQKHGGQIKVDSKPGKTRFRIRLPLDRVPKGEHETGSELTE